MSTGVTFLDTASQGRLSTTGESAGVSCTGTSKDTGCPYKLVFCGKRMTIAGNFCVYDSGSEGASTETSVITEFFKFEFFSAGIDS
ncbi:hypothetical protein ADUPG1_005158 [Aduncisulcus paluster]|uniref:Uncharacterized protein n=1 Tax=Aduncisulcus paluster TaxID=2918883 RepID=A0ABQ5K972_9EUKA|nr:hypothetical protein ADUPG1_005158 [Aduncisulcus paluster]